MSEVPHIYVNDKLVGIGDCKIEVKQKEPNYKVQIIHDEDVDCPLPDYTTLYLNYKKHDYSKHKLSELIEGLDIILNNFEDLAKVLSNDKEKYYVVYAYIHSNISLSLTPHACKFDSGVYGLLKIDEPLSNDEVEEIIRNLNLWLEDNCYIVNITDELGNEIDSICNVFADEAKDIYVALELCEMLDKYGITMSKIQSAWNMV